MGAALIAYVDRAAGTIMLDPAVRSGARIERNLEAVLLHTTSIGHCSEEASHYAHRLREQGWTVTVRSLDVLAPIRAAGGSAVNEVPTDQDPVAEPVPEQPVSTSRSHPRRSVCLTCGHATWGTRHVDSHRRNLGHHDFEQVLVADVPALQARIRAQNQQT